MDQAQLDISKQHASRYMAFAHATGGGNKSRYENFGEFMQEEGGDPGYGKVVRKRDWHDGVKETVQRARKDMDRIWDAELTRVQEREADHKLAKRLIEIGFKCRAVFRGRPRRL